MNGQYRIGKIDYECRVFQNKWIDQYYVIECKGKVTCLVRREYSFLY